ncbi:MarR family winged helix-turn-helix transcriptional regulator [Desulfoluna spongiiphila]|uniref:DNA-binding transcriptional regulator, MarR family n=1 Tax=Desulfoluna spongiiphila TaxID=419481 RepID=A0A1G5AR94_9BACT|nr:MarR family transcriptional regulator [Desulfoluna spongiiphila]SCX80423.1 DNA-binding transcriptional regulator, MarR family [Desulfoluna spongiiphila]VVS91959.1 transcriptional regulator marr-type conserved site [Desulfoluna spongiiphila]
MTAQITYNECIVFLLAKANQKAQKNLKKRMKSFGLTTVQGLILGAIYEDNGLTASEIGQRLVLDNATVSGVLDRLIDGGWITKKSDENDRRVQRILLTEQANASIVNELIQVRSDANEETMNNLSLEERVLLKRLLRDLE